VRDFFGSTLAAAQVGMYGDTRPGPSPSELSAFYDLVQHYLKSLAANLPPGDVVHSSHHSLQVGLSAVTSNKPTAGTRCSAAVSLSMRFWARRTYHSCSVS
jgi:hypothetical protein